MMKNNIFNLEYQYQLYLTRTKLKETLMGPAQKKETRQAFMAACGQMLLLLRDEVSDMEEEQAAEIFQDMLQQVHDYFMKAANKSN